jgi:hypothetical protein
MLNFVIFMVLSVLESTAMFFLTFKVFKIDLYVKEILFAGLIMGFISYVLRQDYGLAQLDIVTQYVLTFCFLWLLFRIHVFYAAIMTGLSYLAYMLIQSMYYLMMNLTGLYSLHFPSITVGIYILQFISAVTAIFVGLYISKRRKGFDFVPDKPNEKVKIKLREIIIFALSIPSVGIVLLMIFLSQKFSQFFFLMPLAYGILLYGYLYFSYKKDRSDNEYIS